MGPQASLHPHPHRQDSPTKEKKQPSVLSQPQSGTSSLAPSTQAGFLELKKNKQTKASLHSSPPPFRPGQEQRDVKYQSCVFVSDQGPEHS